MQAKSDPISIKYSAEYTNLLKQHKENMARKDYTVNTLNVITSLLFHCPTNYTVWVDRREVIRNISTDLHTYADELQWIKKQAAENQKNYQVWHHFKFVLSKIDHEISEDLEILKIAKKEPKNIHFWGTLLACSKKKESALEYTKYFIECDVRNNSAYSIRYSLILPILKNHKQRICDEKCFLLSLPILKHNLAYWNYVTALEEEFPEYEILKACELALKSKTIPKYYQD